MSTPLVAPVAKRGAQASAVAAGGELAASASASASASSGVRLVPLERRVASPAPPEPEPPQSVTLLTVNDVYELRAVDGRGGLAELATLLTEERARVRGAALTTVNGDFLSAGALAPHFRGMHMIDVFNALRVDAVVHGNHEFDWACPNLRRCMDASRFAWLGSNVVEAGGERDGEPFHTSVRSCVRVVGGVHVGLLGVCTLETPDLSWPDDTVRFTPVRQSIERAVAELDALADPPDVLVALTHVSIEEDMEIARAFPQLSLVLGGHDHIPYSMHTGPTLVHKSGENATHLGSITLTLPPRQPPSERHPRGAVDRSRVQFDWRMLANTRRAPDDVVRALINSMYAKLDTLFDEQLTVIAPPLDSRSLYARSRGVSMGNLLTDAMRHVFAKHVAERRCDLALINGGFIRGNRLYDANTPFSRGDVLREFPFQPPLFAVRVRGRHVRAIIEDGLRTSHRVMTAAFPQVSGMRFTFSPCMPVGERLLHLTLDDGTEIDDERDYIMATSGFLFLKGGDGYHTLHTESVNVTPDDVNIVGARCVEEYLSDRAAQTGDVTTPIDVDVEERAVRNDSFVPDAGASTTPAFSGDGGGPLTAKPPTPEPKKEEEQ